MRKRTPTKATIALVGLAFLTACGSESKAANSSASPQRPIILTPAVYDPDGADCVTSQFINYEHKLVLRLDKQCPTVDPDHPDGTAAGAHIAPVQGITVQSLGFDITAASPCGGGVPRFDVEGMDGTIWFFQCSDLKQGTVITSPDKQFLRITCDPSSITPSSNTKQFPDQPDFTPTTLVKSMTINLDVGPAIVDLKNVTVNNQVLLPNIYHPDAPPLTSHHHGEPVSP